MCIDFYCLCAKIDYMENQLIYGGKYYKQAIKELRSKNPCSIEIEDLLSDGNFDCELYCVSMTYSRYFDVNTAPIESIFLMLHNLQVGREANFWLSFYQSADLIEKLHKSVYKGKTLLEFQNKRVYLLEAAKQYFRKLPRNVSNISLSDIEKEISYEYFKM